MFIPESIKRFYKYWFRSFPVRSKVDINYYSTVSKESTFEGANKIGMYSRFHGHLGYGTYLGISCRLSANIGRFTSIANNVNSNPGIHPYELPYLSTSPIFFSTRRQCGKTFVSSSKFYEFKYFDEKNKVDVQIGSDCWIGENCFLVGGVHIGDGAVVLANACVTKNVPPFAIVGGVPAKILRYRYSPEIIGEILTSKWWNRDINFLKENSDSLCDYEKFRDVFLDEE